MKKLLGPHLGGLWANKLDVLRQWQPPLALVLSPDVEKVAQLRAACPQAIIVGRFYHDDNHYASNIAARPKEFAREIHNEIIGNPVTPLLDYVQSNNEVCQDWQGIQRLDVFTQAWMALADQSGDYKCAILAFSVGNPDMPHKPGDPAGFDGRMLYWQQVLPSLNYAQRNDHILLLHAYGYPNMFAPDADWYIYRYERQVQAHLRTLGITDLKYVYGEIGIDRLIVNGKGGYKVVTTDQDYVNQLLQWEKDQQGQSLLLGGAIFTFGDSGGWDSYDIASGGVASMLATHYVEHADDYESTPVEGQNDMTETFLPSVGTGTVAAPALPPREWDARLTARGVTIETPPIAPGQQFWRVVKARWYDEQEADALGPDHHIVADVLNYEGERVVGVSLNVKWPTDDHDIWTEAKPGEPYGANYPMSPSRNEFSVRVTTGVPSETVKGIGMGAGTPSGFNAGIHTSTGVVFQRTTMPAIEAPPPAPVEPVPSLPAYVFVTAPAGANLRAKPNLTADIVGVMPVGTRLYAVGMQGEWYEAVGGGADAIMVSRIFYVHKSVVGLTPNAPVEPTEPTPTQGDNWSRAWPIVLKIEGGLSTDRTDKGNYRPDGTFVGTRWGISALSHPAVDIVNLTKEDALKIYHRDYWLASGSDRLPWPLCLVHFDAYVQNQNAAKKFLAASGGNPDLYIAERIDWYTTLDTWQHHGRGWVRRCATMLREASK